MKVKRFYFERVYNFSCENVVSSMIRKFHFKVKHSKKKRNRHRIFLFYDRVAYNERVDPTCPPQKKWRGVEAVGVEVEISWRSVESGKSNSTPVERKGKSGQLYLRCAAIARTFYRFHCSPPVSPPPSQRCEEDRKGRLGNPELARNRTGSVCGRRKGRGKRMGRVFELEGKRG